jgi:soluble lytic murein transglycosylase
VRGAILVLAGALCSAAVPGKVSDPVEVLVEVRHDWNSGKLDEALERLAVLEESDLADHVALIRARILREKGEVEAAIAAARRGLQRDPPSEVEARLHHEIAQMELERDDLLAAYREQRRAWESSRHPESSAALMMEMAQAFDQRQLPGDSVRLYRGIWQAWPLSEVADAAFDRSAALTAATGAPEPSPQELLDYAESLRKSARCERALGSYKEVLAHEDVDDERRGSAERGRAYCLFNRRRYDEASFAYRAIVEADPEDVDAEIRIARSLARAGRIEPAVKQFEELARTGNSATRARAEYLTAVLLQQQRPARAEELFRSVEKQRAIPRLSRGARWELAWASFLRGEHQTALKRLTPLARGSRWDVEVQRARYWRAMAQLALDEQSGRELLRGLTESLPLSYYGLIATDRLGERPTLEHSFVGRRSAEGKYRAADRAKWLVEAGFSDLGKDEIESWLRGQAALGRDSRLAAAGLLHTLGDHFRAVRIVIDGFGGALEQGIDPAWREAWQLAWPRPYYTPVRRATTEFEFDPALVYAVMREESTYRPDIASSAGAMGLMQIIPQTGDRIASSLGVPAFRADILFHPDTNIRFGTFYLKRLVGRFSGSEVLAIAAYNAGPNAVSRWLKRDGPRAQDVFVESVPYGETRRYLRRVVRSQRVYQLLYDGRP